MVLGLRTAPKTPAAPLTPDGEVQALRLRARHRLIGAVVLIGIGVVAFPLLYESHPRPIPIDIPIVITDKDKAAPLAMPPSRSSSMSGMVAAPAASGRPTPAAPVRAASVEAPAAVPTASALGDDAGSAAPAVAMAKPTATAAVATAASAAAPPAAVAPAASGPARFVIQVGAYAEDKSARDARAKVERLGLKTYTQVVDTAGGPRTRVRVGPYTSRDDASKVVAKLKSAGLPASLLTL